MLPASVKNHAPVEIAVNVLERKIAMPSHLARNLNHSFVDHHWMTQMSLVLYLALQAGRTRVLVESLALPTRRAKEICHRFLSLQLRLRQLRSFLSLQLRLRQLRSRQRLRRISQQSIRLRILRHFQQTNLRISQHPNQHPTQRDCQQRIRRIIRQRCQLNILPNILLPALPSRQLFQSSSMFQKSHFIVVSTSSMQLKSAVFRAQTGHLTALPV